MIGLMLAVSASLGSGCNNDFDCLDLGCDPGRICEESTGECIDKGDECEEGSCPSESVCNTATGRCEPKTLSCRETRSCPEGQICDGTTGFCVSDAACTTNDCGDAEQCDQESGECLPIACSNDRECPSGYICDESGRCSAGCRVETPNCPSGQRCWPISENAPGQCRNQCTAHRDCPHGQYCASETNRSVCRPEGPCDADADCRRADEVCRNGACTAPPCESNEACGASQVCDRATGLCVGGDCSDDNFAPNQTRHEATALEFETYAGLQLCPGRDDWFAIEVDSAESLAIRLVHPAESDLDFTVFGADGEVVALNQQAPSRPDGEASTSVSFVTHRAQTLALRIYSGDRLDAEDETGEQTPSPVPTSATYTLSVEHADDLLCRDDRYEENDAREEAARLPSSIGSEPEYPFLRVCGGDTDWYRLPDVAEGAQLEAELQNAPSHFRLDILGADGARYEREPDDRFHLWRNGDAQDWFLRVASRRQIAGDYGLTYAVGTPWQCPGAGDHGDAEAALQLPRETRRTYTLCPLDDAWEDDWIALEPPPSETYLDIQVVEHRGSPPLDVTLFERREEKLGLLRTAHRRDGRHDAALEVDPSQSILLRIASPETPAKLMAKPEYDVVYGYEEDSD